MFLNCPRTPSFILLPFLSFSPNNHVWKLSFCALIANPRPTKAPPITPTGDNDAPSIPSLPTMAAVKAPVPAPSALIPNNLPPSLSSSPESCPLILFNTELNDAIIPFCPVASSPNKNSWNICDLTNIPPAIPKIEPRIGPPTKLPSIPPESLPIIPKPRAPCTAPRAPPAANAVLFSLK